MLGFRSTLADGSTLVLCVEDLGAGADALACASALAAHEALIVALEQWLAQPLDPAPDDVAGMAGTLCWAEFAGGRLGLPWSLLLQAGPPPSPLQWPEQTFDVELAGFERAPLPADADAGVLLLPPSFEPEWTVQLRARTGAASGTARWHGPELPPQPCDGFAQRAAAPWRVMLERPWRAPLTALLGHAPAPQVALGAAAMLVGPDGPRCGGRIVPALGGSALRVEP